MKKSTAAPTSVSPARDADTLEMFPELIAALPAAKPLPLSPAERQRRRRGKKRELRESQGLKEVPLLASEREALANVVMLLEISAPTMALEARQALLQKLAPGMPWVDDDVLDKSWAACSMPPAGRCVDDMPLDVTLQLNRFDLGLLWCAVDVLETARSDLKHRESPLVWDSLQRIFGGQSLGFDWQANLGQDSATLIQAKRDRVDKQRGWKAYEDECKTSKRLRDELWAAKLEVRRLQQTLEQIAQEVVGSSE